MAAAFKPRLGNVLAGILPGDQPPFPGTRMPGEMGFPDMTPGQGMGQPAPKGGFFKEGGMGRTIAGLIGDALLQQADMAPVYAPAMRQRQAMAAEEAQWSRRREADRADKQWEWANKPPADRQPYRFQDNAGNLVEIGADGQPRIAYKDPTPKTTYITADNGDGTKTIIPVVNGIPQMGAGPQGSPPKRNLGPVVDSVPGGPQASPAGTFPRR